MYQFLNLFVEPYPGVMLALGIALAVAWRRGGLVGKARWWVGGVYLFLYFLSVTPSSAPALASLEWQHPVPAQWAADAQAIVVLSAAFMPPTQSKMRFEGSPASLMRCVHAADVHKHTRLPVLASGGLSGGKVPEESDARQMRELLVLFGVPEGDVILEDQSQSTFENARESARILHERGIKKVILVTDAVHMPRAALCFRKQGIEIQAAPCLVRVPTVPSFSMYWILPSTYNLAGNHQASKEWLGIVWYWLKGRI